MNKDNRELGKDLTHATVTDKLLWEKINLSRGKSIYTCKTTSGHSVWFKFFDMGLRTTHEMTHNDLKHEVIMATRSADIETLDVMIEIDSKKALYCTMHHPREFINHVLENIGKQLIKIQVTRECERIALRQEVMKDVVL